MDTRGLVERAKRTMGRLRAVWGSRGLGLVHHPGYAHRLPGVPHDPDRAFRIVAALDCLGLRGRIRSLRPEPAAWRDLLRVHTAEYLERLRDPETVGAALGTTVTAAEAEQAVALQRLMTGGTLLAFREAVARGGLVANLGGGFHHALPDRGQGFCLLNDVAVATAALREQGWTGRVLVVDLDLHDGNGTRRFFSTDPSVHTLSVHAETWGATEAIADTTVALGSEVDDRTYLDAVHSALDGVYAHWEPQLVVYLAGTDPARGDRLGHWSVSPDALLARDRLVLKRAGAGSVPIVVVLAGGYGGAAWRPTARMLAWYLTRRQPSLPEDESLGAVLRRRATAPDAGGTSRSSEPFTLTEADLWGVVPAAAATPRFLGHLPAHAVELSLERLGVIEGLRERGFDDPRVELTMSGPDAETVRIRDRAAGDEPLMELRATRSRIVPGHEVLRIEWLLLQNPLESFGPHRPPLPGQSHPGLGLLRDVLAWLVGICQNLGLDGIYFVAAHYHIAVQSRRRVRFLHPEDEARMRAFETALEGLPLRDATRLAADGALSDAATGAACPWTPTPMVLPVSAALRRLVEGPDYQGRLEAPPALVRADATPA